jgi:hypothetical protein
VGNLPLHLQPKLLTALEQRKVTPVGASKPIDIDVRVLSATNMAPAQLADESRFRKDLLFRLNTVEIRLPPLRERPEDIPLLLDHYLSEFARSYDKPQRACPPRCWQGCAPTAGRAMCANCAMPPSAPSFWAMSGAFPWRISLWRRRLFQRKAWRLRHLRSKPPMPAPMISTWTAPSGG